MSKKIGKVKTWDDEKGFGFITPASGGKDLFFHISNYSRRHKKPIDGLTVYYDPSKDLKGRVCAVGVIPRKGHTEMGRTERQQFTSVIVSCIFAACLVYYNLKGNIPTIILGGYLVVSIVTFIAYYLDKSAARQNQWRTPEHTLHLLSFIGGWPGASIAQSFLRHKSKKLTFQIVYWLTVGTNIFTMLVIVKIMMP